MIYVDSCIPMYLVGAAHPFKDRVIELVPGLIESGGRFVSSAKTFQKTLHRYIAIKAKDKLALAYSALEEMAELVLPVTKRDTDLARYYSAEFPGLSSRDCLHSAPTKNNSISKIWTYDKCFDDVPFLTRIC